MSIYEGKVVYNFSSSKNMEIIKCINPHILRIKTQDSDSCKDGEIYTKYFINSSYKLTPPFLIDNNGMFSSRF